MKSSRKLRILKVKEYISRAKLQKANAMIERSNSSIEQLSSYSLAYLSASRKKDGLTAYEMNNVVSMSKNLREVASREKHSQAALNHICKVAREEWIRQKQKVEYIYDKEEEEGNFLLSMRQETDSEKMVNLKILEGAITKK